MALATRCPYCNTTFRVTHDQLKLRGGLVRCGACKEIFNGVEHLLAAQQPAAPGSAESSVTGLPVSGSQATGSPATDSPPPGAGSAHVPGSPAAVASSGSATSFGPAQAAEHSAENASPPADALPPAETASPAADAAPGPARTDEAPSTPASARTEQGEAADTAGETAEAESEVSGPAAPAAYPFAKQDLPASPLPPTTPEQDLDPLTRMTLMDMRPWPQSDTRLPADAPATASGSHPTRATDEIERALGELQEKPWRGSVHAAAQEDVDEIDALDNEEPDFVRQARVQAQRQRSTRLILALGSVLLALLALMQAAIVMRTEIAARWPATLPALSQLCNLAGCRIGLPQQIEYVTIESHELQALPNSENGFLLSTLLRNRSKVAQAWPYLELTLNDPADQPVARRVLAPADYLPAAERARGMAPSSERPVRVSFTLSQLKASGYRLYVFYP